MPVTARKVEPSHAATDLALRCVRCSQLYPRDTPHVCASPERAAPSPAASAVATGKESPSGPAKDPVAASGPEPTAPPDPLIGVVLGGRYQILARLSSGGMGVVYKARHILLKSLVAVKILLEQQDEEAQLRFLQEAQLASHIQHPNTVYISDFGVLSDGRAYLVMEFLSGPTLAKALEGGPLGPLRACQVALQIARGLLTIHDKGIVHRDLKPAKVAAEAGRSGRVPRARASLGPRAQGRGRGLRRVRSAS